MLVVKIETIEWGRSCCCCVTNEAGRDTFRNLIYATPTPVSRRITPSILDVMENALVRQKAVRPRT
jgi:hypothetical protein